MDANSEGWKEISLRYGDIIAVKMSGSNYFLGSNGQSECEVELRDLCYSESKNRNVRPYESLFRVLPLQYSTAMVECIAFTGSTDQTKRAQLLNDLENEQSANTQRSNSHWGTTVLINQSITLEHLLSRKYLTLKPSNLSMNSYNLHLETAENDETALTFSPFYQHKINKNDTVIFSDKLALSAANLRDVSVSLNCSVKLSFEIENILRHSNIQVAVQKEVRKAPNVIKAQDIQFSKDNSKVTPFELVKFRDCDFHELSEEIPAGSVCLLFHLETGTTVREESIIPQKQHNQDIPQSTSNNPKDNSTQQVKYSLKYQENARDSQCLWIIQKLNLLEGGHLNYKDLIRLQNLRSGSFLSLGRNGQQTIEGTQESTSFSNEIFQILTEGGIDRTLEENLCCGESFCLYHPFSDKFIDIEFEHVSCTYQLRLEPSAVKVQSFKLAKLDELLCWEIQFVQACRDTLGRSLSEIQSVLGREGGGGAWQISMTSFEQIAKAIGAIDRLLRFIRSSGFFLEDIFLEEVENSPGSSLNSSGGKNSAKIRRIDILLAHQLHSLLFELLTKILSNPITFQKLKTLAEAIKDPEENPYNVIEKDQQQQGFNLDLENTPSNTPRQQQNIHQNNKKIPPSSVAALNPSAAEDTQLIHSSWEMELGKGLAICINQIFDLLTQMVAQDSFPENALRPSIIKCILMMGVGNSWKCMAELLKKYRYADMVITSADISSRKTEFKLFQNLNLIQAISSQYIRTYESEDKYGLDFVEFLIEICRDAPPDIKAKNQILIGKVLFEELSDPEIDRILILLYTVRREQSPAKMLFVQSVGQKMDFQKFTRLTNNNTRGREMNLLLHKIKLKTVICENRNYYNIYALRERFPYYLLLDIIKNEDVNSIIRSVFLEFYMHLYLDVDPFYTNFPRQTIVSDKESLQIGLSKAQNFLTKGKRQNLLSQSSVSQKEIEKNNYSQQIISKQSFTESDPVEKVGRGSELDSQQFQQQKYSEQLIQPSHYQLEKIKSDQKKNSQKQQQTIFKEKIPLVLEAAKIPELDGKNFGVFTQPDDVKEDAKFLSGKNEKQFVKIKVTQEDVASDRPILRDQNQKNNHVIQEIIDNDHLIEIDIESPSEDNNETVNSGKQQIQPNNPEEKSPHQHMITSRYKNKRPPRLFKKLSQKNIAELGVDIYDGKYGENSNNNNNENIQEETNPEYQSEDALQRQEDQLCYELEYRTTDWLDQIKFHVIFKIESLTLNNQTNQFTAVQLRYLYAILQAFKLLITMEQCSVEHRTLKNLLRLFEINTSDVNPFQKMNAPFIQCKKIDNLPKICWIFSYYPSLEHLIFFMFQIFSFFLEKTIKQKSKTLVKELDSQWLTDRIQEEVMDIYLFMMDKQKEEKIQTIIGFLSSKIESVATLEAKINFSYGKQKVLMHLKDQYELQKKSEQLILDGIDPLLKKNQALEDNNSLIHQIKKDEKNKLLKEQIRQYDESISKCEAAIDTIINASLLELLKLPEIGGQQIGYDASSIGSNYSMGIDVTNTILLCLQKQQEKQQLSNIANSSCIMKMLQLLQEIVYQPSQLISAFQSKQILLRQDDIDKYEVLKALCDVLCSFQERRFILWLSEDNETRSSLLQVINVVMLKSSKHLQDANKKLESGFKEEDYLFKVQSMILSLNIHYYAIQFLQDIYTAAREPENTAMLQQTLTIVFNFLVLFAKDNIQTQQILKNYRDVFCKYLDCPEAGQSSFFAAVFLLSPQLPPPVNALAEFVQSLRVKNLFLRQINPSDLSVLLQVLKQRPDMESRLFSEIFDSTLIYSFFGMLDLLPELKEGQDEEEEEKHFQNCHLQIKELNLMQPKNLDQQQRLLYQSIIADLDMQTDRKKRKLCFEIDWNVKERCPYIYQAYALRTVREIFELIQGQEKMADQLKLIFSTSYLFELLGQDDYFSRKSEHHKTTSIQQQQSPGQSPKSIIEEEYFLRIILKMELMNTMRVVWLERLSYPLDMIRNNSVLRFLEYIVKLLQNFSKSTADSFDMEIAKIRNGSQISQFSQFVQQYLQSFAPKDSRLSFDEPLGEITYIFKHLLPFVTHLKNVFDLLRNAHWYPAELPHPELRLMKHIGEKFEELFFSKFNSISQNDLREAFRREIMQFSKVYCTRNPFMESAVQNQQSQYINNNNQQEQDRDLTPFLKNLSLAKSSNQNDHNMLPVPRVQTKNVLLSPMSASPSGSQNLISFTNLSNNYLDTNPQNKPNNLHKAQPKQMKNAGERDQMNSSRKSQESPTQNLEVSAMQPQPPIQMTNIFNYKLQPTPIQQKSDNKIPKISSTQQLPLPTKKQIFLQIEFSSHLVGMNLPDMRCLFSLRRQEQNCNTYRRVFLHAVSSQSIRKEIILPQSTFLFTSIFSDLSITADNLISSLSTVPITSNTKSFFFCRQICSRLTYFLNQLPIEDPTNLLLLDPVLSSVDMLIELLSYLPQSNRRSIQQIIHFECLRNIFQSSRFFSCRKYLSILLKLFGAVYTADANQAVIDDLFLIFDTQPSVEYFFAAIASVISDQLAQSSQILHNQQRIFHLINSLPIFSFDKYSFNLFHDISKFIQLLNSHNSRSFTKFWRKQVSSTKSYDFMALYIKLFDALIKNTILFGSTQTSFGYSVFYHELTVDCLQVILSMIKKDEPGPKDYLMRSTFLDNMSQLWETPKTTGLTKENQTTDFKMQYFLVTQGMKMSQQYFDNAFLQDNVKIIKNHMLEIFERLIEGDYNGDRRQQIVRKLSFSNLSKYLQAFYSEFKDEYKGYYSNKAHSFIKYGFNIFLLLEQESESQRIIQQSQSATEINENAKQFAQAYEFLNHNSGQIEILIDQNTLVNIHFLYYSHSLASTPEIEKSILQKISRLPEQLKRKQFFLSAEEYDVRLKIEQDLRDKVQNGKILIRFLQYCFRHLNKLRYVNFGIAIADNFYLLLKYQDISGSKYFDKIRDGSLDLFIIITLACLFAVNGMILIFSFLQASKYLSWKSTSDLHKEIQLEEEQRIEDSRRKAQKQRDHLVKAEKKLSEKNAREQAKLDNKLKTDRENLLQEKKKQYELMKKKEKGNSLIARQHQQQLQMEQQQAITPKQQQAVTPRQQSSTPKQQHKWSNQQANDTNSKQDKINQDTQETNSYKQDKISLKYDMANHNQEKKLKDKSDESANETQNKQQSSNLRNNSTIELNKKITSVNQFYKSQIQLKSKQELPLQSNLSSSPSKSKPTFKSLLKYNQGLMNLLLQSVRTIRICITNVISQNDLSYVLLYTPVLFVTLFFNEFFAALLLLDVFAQFPETMMILTVLYRLKTKILSSMALFLILVYFFALAAYLIGPIQTLYGNYCTNLLSCFSVILDSTLRSFVTAPPIYDTVFDTYNDKFHLSYEDIYLFLYVFFLVSLIWTWIFTAFFIDAYSKLRREQEEQLANSTKICLVCGLDRKQIEQISPQGFDFHITKVHNPWEYLKYISILLTKPPNELTAIEKYVFEAWKNGDISWIQTNQLQSMQREQQQQQQ